VHAVETEKGKGCRVILRIQMKILSYSGQSK
jgi:hypothetical protein